MPPGPRTESVSPGMLLAGRHRLLRAIATTGATVLWRAEDTVLSRPVAVRTLAGPFDDLDPQAYLEAATRAGRITHPRVGRVLDAFLDDHDPGQVPVAAVVSEWVEGLSLGSLLRDGPLDNLPALDLTDQLLVALRATHDAGAAHGRLHPGNVILDSTGTVTVTDAEVAAALAGTIPDDDPRVAEADDLRHVGALLYACLTGRWPLDPDDGPGGGNGGLEPAPWTDGRRATPRQMRAGVPRSLDSLALRLLDDVRKGEPAVHSIDDAVRAVAVCREELIVKARPRREPGAALLPGWLRVVLPLAVVAAVGVAGWQAGLQLGKVPGTSTVASLPVIGGGPGAVSSAIPGQGTDASLAVVGLTDFDPLGDGTENPSSVGLAADGDLSTAWETSRYTTAAFGGLKTGVGLVVDLGEVRDVGSVRVQVLADGTDVELRSAGAATTAPTSLDGFPVVATSASNSDQALLKPAQVVRARYLLVWLTQLPAVPGGFRGGIAELTVISPR